MYTGWFKLINIYFFFHFAWQQIILCHNQIYEYQDCAEILSHELIHAFDYCRSNIDINNNYHVACTEVCWFLFDITSSCFKNYNFIYLLDQGGQFNILFNIWSFSKWFSCISYKKCSKSLKLKLYCLFSLQSWISIFK